MRMMRSLFTIKVKNNDVRTPECTDIYVNVKELSRLNGLFGGPRKEEEEEEKKERKKERKKKSRRPYLVLISECDHASPEVLKTRLIFTKFPATYHLLLLVLFPPPLPLSLSPSTPPFDE